MGTGLSSQPDVLGEGPDVPEADEDGVEAALVRHGADLRAYLRRRLRDRHEVEDVVHDVYLRALSMDQAKKVQSWRGFLLRVASNLLIDRKRRDDARRRGDHVPLEAEAPIVDGHGHSPERTLLAREELAVLSRALQDLDPRTRQVFLSVRVDGLSHRDAGALVGVDAKTASRMVERALAVATRRLLALRTETAS